MDRSFWEQACNATVSRPLSALKQSNYIANTVAVNLSRCHMNLPRRLLTLSPDFHLRMWCRGQRDILFAGLQAAAVEAEWREEQRGGRGPRVEEPADVLRLDVHWLLGGSRHILPLNATAKFSIRFS